MSLILEGIKLIYVFDGKAPALKGRTQENRQEAKDIAAEKYEQAKDEEDTEAMGKYARQIVHLDKEKIEESKALLKAMGIAVIQAPGEGEAQASFICKNGDAYATASQDYDCLVFNSPKLIQNLTLAKKRKTATGFIEIKPQMIELSGVLAELGINHEQLTCIAILSGTDYNPGGVKGIGPKKALKLVLEHKTKEKIFEAVENLVKEGKYKIDFDWKEIYELMSHPDVDEKYKIEFPKFDFVKVKEIMTEHDFSEERIENQLSKIMGVMDARKQKTLF